MEVRRNVLVSRASKWCGRISQPSTVPTYVTHPFLGDPPKTLPPKKTTHTHTLLGKRGTPQTPPKPFPPQKNAHTHTHPVGNDEKASCSAGEDSGGGHGGSHGGRRSMRMGCLVQTPGEHGPDLSMFVFQFWVWFVVSKVCFCSFPILACFVGPFVCLLFFLFFRLWYVS